ncbi:MAG: SDR family oxidoreductase [Patulibacter sp.]|nr:SDR family oxidoreductase [Patulibacter sp.]
MTRVLVLGAGGMLGHKLVQRLGSRFDVESTLRADALPEGYEQVLDADRIRFGVRADRFETVERAIETTAPDVVVNAIGIVKQLPDADREGPTMEINARFPHELAAFARPRGIRVVQISTDCVFSGDRGGYAESDAPDPVDLYGRSKLEGELDEPGTLTVRTSIVGRELRDAHGLFEWFLGNEGARVRGFSHAIFSGLTTAALSDLVGDLIADHPDLHGVWHASAAPIDKLSLLQRLASAMHLTIEIEPDDRLRIDRSLDSSRLRAATGWEAPSWTEMLEAVAADPTPYDQIRGGR